LVTAQVVWLDGRGVDLGEVGARAAALAQLRGEGLPVPRAFALGRSLLGRINNTRGKHDQAALIAGKLPADVQREIGAALRTLGGSYAIRRSPLDPTRVASDDSWLVTTRGGRPERETYLNLTDIAEVSEAVRRIWGQAHATSPPRPAVAIVVQRFVAPEVCALVRHDREAGALHVLSTLGVGDLLAAGLVVPDRHTIRRHDGGVITSSLGRKAQMSIPKQDGGMARVPVPAAAARLMALDEPKLVELARTWRIAEESVGPLYSLAVAWSGGRWYVTTVVPEPVTAQEGLMLG
jgi:phosphoenolpyruvate synthase/pyruvate phosphate dikinase